MQMKFTKELPVWLAPGIKPPESLTIDGWKASQKPPADYFNWFFSRTHGALKELQDSATHIEDFNAHKSNISNPHAVTATQVGLGNVLNQKQATKSEFDAHDQDNIRHITDVERNSWNGKAEKNHTQPWSTITGIPDSTITKKGIVKLTDSVTSTDILTAATPNSVKQVNDNANAAMASASSVNDNLTSHKIDYKNPHKVTSAQVGSYSKTETDDLFINKSEAENGLLVRKNIEITDLNNAKEPGIYSIPATGVENKPLPNSGSLFVSKDPGGVRQLFQTERTIVIRQFGGVPSNWTDWKEVAFTTNVVNLTEPQKIGGTKDFDEIPLVNQTPVMLQKEQLYEAWYTPGKDHNDLHNRSRFSIGAEYSNVGKRLGLPMRSNPLQWNAGRWLATVLRDCKLNVRAVVKIQAEGSRGIPYAYVHLGKGYEEATGDMGTAGGTGAITGINYKNFIPVELNVSLKKGDYFSFYLEVLEGKNINFVQMISAHITELV
ncbi:TPA: pyocin knob domain-containing protein [Enterococcus faecalis]